MYSTCTHRLSSRPTFIRFSGRMKKPGGAHSRAIRSAHTDATLCTVVGGDATPGVALARASSPFVKTLYCRPPGAVFKARTRMYTGRKSAPLQFYTYITRAVWVLWLPARGEKICDRTRRHVHVLPVFSASPPFGLVSIRALRTATVSLSVSEEIRVIKSERASDFFSSSRFSRFPHPLFGRKTHRDAHDLRNTIGNPRCYLATIFNYRVRITIVISQDLSFLVMRYSLTSMFLLWTVYRPIYTSHVHE